MRAALLTGVASCLAGVASCTQTNMSPGACDIGVIWGCLKLGCYWHLEGGGQDCC